MSLTNVSCTSCVATELLLLPLWMRLTAPLASQVGLQSKSHERAGGKGQGAAAEGVT